MTLVPDAEGDFAYLPTGLSRACAECAKIRFITKRGTYDLIIRGGTE